MSGHTGSGTSGEDREVRGRRVTSAPWREGRRYTDGTELRLGSRHVKRDGPCRRGRGDGWIESVEVE